MKKIIVVIALTVSVLSCKKETREIDVKEKNVTTIKKDEMPKKKVLSPHATAMAMIGDAHIHIDYSSPGVRDRIIFGGLLSYDMVWQAGAHNATWLETNQDLIIDGKTLPAGKYGFFTIPSKKEWTIIFNTNWDQHGKDDYDEKEDVLRFKVKSILSETTTEHLEYKVKKTTDTQGSISLAWEKVLIDFNFIVQQ
ncbi:hypothetical protein BST83_19120 [Polaribacter filamentus]|uniref:DUF2911 domain-containing protein n=1 Tax=Polaribacter filamentus TaxID=53483 RepID=A0A2S7KLA7_9FLAO|nr:DUF2911 domain-containing protein [Polaribacter filamentus]PQB03392.1 hypothetical protein BST83_19120 [Polaribacter filamentus]